MCHPGDRTLPPATHKALMEIPAQATCSRRGEFMSQRSFVPMRIFGAALIGLACTVQATGDARAGTLIINISDGSISYDIFDQLPPDVNFNLNQIMVDPTTLL